MLQAMYEEHASTIVNIDWYFGETREFVHCNGTFPCPSYMDSQEFERRVCTYFRRRIMVFLNGRHVSSRAIRVGDLTTNITGSRLQFKHIGNDEYIGDLPEDEFLTTIRWELFTSNEFRGSWGTITVPMYMTAGELTRRLRSFWGRLPIHIFANDGEDEDLYEPEDDRNVHFMTDIQLEAEDPESSEREPVIIGHPDTDNYVHLPHYSSRVRNRGLTAFAPRFA